MYNLLWTFLEDVAASVKDGESLELVVDGEDMVVAVEVAEKFYKKAVFSQPLVMITQDMLRIR